MDEGTRAKIAYEIEQIDTLMESASVLFALCRQKEPDFIERSAAGSVLNSFYNGIENIFLLYARAEGFRSRAGGHWHRNLLDFMFAPEGGGAIPEAYKLPLEEYMGFRHFFRHAYGYTLKWEKCGHLFLGMQEFWHGLREELEKLP